MESATECNIYSQIRVQRNNMQKSTDSDQHLRNRSCAWGRQADDQSKKQSGQGRKDHWGKKIPQTLNKSLWSVFGTMQELEENLQRELAEGFTPQGKTSGEVTEERGTNGGRWGLSLPSSTRNQVTAVWNFWVKPAWLSSDWKLAKMTASFCDFSGWKDHLLFKKWFQRDPGN